MAIGRPSPRNLVFSVLDPVNRIHPFPPPYELVELLHLLDG
jgi:hypothetical protein